MLYGSSLLLAVRETLLSAGHMGTSGSENRGPHAKMCSELGEES